MCCLVTHVIIVAVVGRYGIAIGVAVKDSVQLDCILLSLVPEYLAAPPPQPQQALFVNKIVPLLPIFNYHQVDQYLKVEVNNSIVAGF